MVEPDDIITRYGAPISPKLSMGIGGLLIGVGAWLAYRAVAERDESRFGIREVVLASVLVLLWFGAFGGGAIAIGSKQAELIALEELK